MENGVGACDVPSQKRSGFFCGENEQFNFAPLSLTSCRLSVDGQKELTLESGDFVLLSTTPGFHHVGVRAHHSAVH
jgi:hypothetical protein